MTKNKKYVLIIIIESGCIFSFILCLLFNFITNRSIWAIFTPFDQTEHLLTQEFSDDQSASISLYEIGEPLFFGASQIKIVYSSSTSHYEYISTTLSNDGKRLSDDNYSIVWQDQIPYITLSGEEQNDVIYSLFVP